MNYKYEVDADDWSQDCDELETYPLVEAAEGNDEEADGVFILDVDDEEQDLEYEYEWVIPLRLAERSESMTNYLEVIGKRDELRTYPQEKSPAQTSALLVQIKKRMKEQETETETHYREVNGLSPVVPVPAKEPPSPSLDPPKTGFKTKAWKRLGRAMSSLTRLLRRSAVADNNNEGLEDEQTESLIELEGTQIL